jgi:hypothetical protein
MKRALSVVVPTTSSEAPAGFINSFLASEAPQHLSIKFFFLINKKRTTDKNTGDVVFSDCYSIFSIYSDRYYGSCEENLYRIRDFFDLLDEQVIVLGDTDEVSWDSVLDVLKRCQSGADVIALSVDNHQKNIEGAIVVAPLLPMHLLSAIWDIGTGENRVIDGYDALRYLIFMTGPLDWSAYIGNHLYTKRAFLRILQEESKEPMYSFLIMQLKAYQRDSIKYLFPWQRPVVKRLGNELVSLIRGQSWGWQVDHRVSRGDSPQCSVGMLSQMLEIDSEDDFDIILNSKCNRHRLDDSGFKLESFQNFFFRTTIRWCRGVLRHRLQTPSQYFPTLCKSGSLKDLGLVDRFAARLAERLRSKTNIYGSMADPLIESLDVFRDLAAAYSESLYCDEAKLHEMVKTLDDFEVLCTDDILERFHKRCGELHFSILL